MRRRNGSGAKKERIIMVLSSVFVLAALTATGLFFRGKSEENNDGYVVDFSLPYRFLTRTRLCLLLWGMPFLYSPPLPRPYPA